MDGKLENVSVACLVTCVLAVVALSITLEQITVLVATLLWTSHLLNVHLAVRAVQDIASASE
jgi:hypothetical protein